MTTNAHKHFAEKIETALVHNYILYKNMETIVKVEILV